MVTSGARSCVTKLSLKTLTGTGELKDRGAVSKNSAMNAAMDAETSTQAPTSGAASRASSASSRARNITGAKLTMDELETMCKKVTFCEVVKQKGANDERETQKPLAPRMQPKRKQH